MQQTATDLGNEQNLTRSEQALLEALLNPENRIKSVTDICKVAKVDRATYYRAFAKPEFVEIYNKRSMDLVKQSVASVLNTFVREAQRGSFQHGKEYCCNPIRHHGTYHGLLKDKEIDWARQSRSSKRH